MRYPVTARDAQRILSHSYDYPACCEIVDALGLPGPRPLMILRWPRAEALAALARIAATSGPDTIILASPEVPSGECRPKGTNKVAPQSADPNDGDPHGGDGASGEVENPAGAGGDNQNNPSSGTGNSGSEIRQVGAPSPQTSRLSDAGQASGSRAETGENSTSADDSNDTSSDTGSGNGLRANGQLGSESGAVMSAKANSAPEETSQAERHGGQGPTDADSVVDPLTGRANSPSPGEVGENGRPAAPAKKSSDANGDAASEKYHYRSVKRASGSSPSTAAKREHGGITAKMSRAGVSPNLVKKARAALARLIDGGESQSGPRWDWTEFTKRLKTGRPLQPAKREEEGRPAILILADVSGSCSGFSDVSLTVAQAVARLGMVGADVVVISHSNGCPCEWQVNQGAVAEAEEPPGDEGILAWYDALIRRFSIKAVVALGDWDAEWLYHWLAEMPQVTRFVWLDNRLCNYTDPRRRDISNELDQSWSAAARRKTTYVVGCKGADDFVSGLKIAIGG